LALLRATAVSHASLAAVLASLAMPCRLAAAIVAPPGSVPHEHQKC